MMASPSSMNILSLFSGIGIPFIMRKSLEPAIIFLSSTVDSIPPPGIILNEEQGRRTPLYDLTIALPRGCSDDASAEAAIARSRSSPTASLTSGFPFVMVPVLSKAIISVAAKRSRASPSFIRKPCFEALPIAAMIAVGVASTREHGQNTTRIVTALMISPVMIHVSAAAVSAVTTIHTAHLSASLTIFAFPASALSIRRTMRWIELSEPFFEASIVIAPN